MHTPLIAGVMDIAELSFYLFAAFFLGLVIYLRREDRREGYPLESDVGGHFRPSESPFQTALPKTFKLPFDRGTVVAPRDGDREPVDVPNARRVAPWSGSAIEPVGNPIGAGVGPGARAKRAPYPDVTFEGHNRIVPMALAHGFSVVGRDPDPRGMPVVGADSAVAGTVSELWVDRSESMLRYLEVDVGARKVLMPMTMCVVQPARGRVYCSALTAAQFADAPYPATAGEITRDEEEQVVAYFGSGYLYATPDRQEPYI